MSGTIKRRLFESSQFGSDPSNFYSADSRKQGKDRYHISIHFFTPLEQSIFNLGETRRAVSGRSKHHVCVYSDQRQLFWFPLYVVKRLPWFGTDPVAVGLRLIQFMPFTVLLLLKLIIANVFYIFGISSLY